MDDLEQLKALIDECETVSFDFFDTLVTRNSASPEAVQQYVGYLLSREDPARSGFFARRVEAERSVRAHQPDLGDADLPAIYAGFSADQGWNGDAIARAQELERTVDMRFVVPRPALAQLMVRAKGAGKRVIVVTDSFYPRAFFDELLERFGWSRLVDAVYVSSVERARKDTGALWSVVIEREHLAGKRFVHVGDNARSDGETAAEAGLRSVLVPRPSALAAERGIRHEPGRDWAADLLLGPLVARRGGDPFSPDSPIVDEHEFGYVVYGPLFLAFFAWLARHPTLRRVERLFFSSREGYFLQRLYDRLRATFGLDHLPASSYLPMSRRAVIMASLARSFDPASVTGHSGFQGSVEALLRARLGYVLDWTSRLAVPVRLPEDQAYVQRLLQILRAQLLERAEEERSALLRFCESVDLTGNREAALVDIGYSGTIQTHLQLILGRPLTGLYMATAPGVAQVLGGGGEAFGCFQDALRGDLRPEGFMHRTVLLEALLTAPHGQLSHFELDGQGEARPTFLENGVSQRNFAMLERVFEGGVDYCTTAIGAGGTELLDAVVPARVSALIPIEAAFAGTLAVSDAIAQVMSMEDAFCGQGERAGLPRRR